MTYKNELKTKNSPKYFVKTKVACLLIVLLFLISCEKKQEDVNQFLKTVMWSKLKKEKKATELKVSGIVQSSDTSDISFEVHGKVSKMYFKLGQNFNKGDLLAELDNRIPLLTVKERESEYLETKARIFEFRNDYKRKKQLVERGSVSKSEYDVAFSQYQTALKKSDVTKARLRIAQEDLKNTKILAPYKGTISTRHVEPPKYLRAGDPVFEIQRKGKLEVSVLISETVIDQIKVGQKAYIKIPALKKSILAKISKIGTNAENANAFPVKLSFKKIYKGLKTGMTAEVSLRLPVKNFSKNHFNIPITAFAAGKKQDHYVFAIKNNRNGNKLEQIPVSVKKISSREVLVEGKLKSGQRIVRTGLTYLRNGQNVRLFGQNQTNYNE